MEPAMNAPAAGTDQAPATSGQSPRTACRYWARNSREPKLMKKPTVFARPLGVCQQAGHV
jgi:hypothetical protein